MGLQEPEAEGGGRSLEKGMGGKVDSHSAKRALVVTNFWWFGMLVL